MSECFVCIYLYDEHEMSVKPRSVRSTVTWVTGGWELTLGAGNGAQVLCKIAFVTSETPEKPKIHDFRSLSAYSLCVNVSVYTCTHLFVHEHGTIGVLTSPRSQILWSWFRSGWELDLSESLMHNHPFQPVSVIL